MDASYAAYVNRELIAETLVLLKWVAWAAVFAALLSLIVRVTLSR